MAKRRTGSVHQVSKNVWEGRYTPTLNGKRIARNIYAVDRLPLRQRLRRKLLQHAEYRMYLQSKATNL